MPQHIINSRGPFVREALRELLGFFLGGVSATPHLLLPGVEHGIARDQTTEFRH